MAHDGIHCSCGRRVKADDVIQHGFVMVKWEPVFVYLKYRCCYCGQVGEELVPCDEWEADVLPPGEVCLERDDDQACSDEPSDLPDPEEAALIHQLMTLSERDWHELRNTI